MRNSILGLGLALAMAGCGGTGTGVDGGGQPVPDLMGARLMSGTYNVTNVMSLKDDCMLGPLKTMIAVVNTGQMLSMGTMYPATSTTPATTLNPAGYTLGTGPYTTNSTATLTYSGVETLDDGCFYNRMDTTSVQFTGTNTLSVDWMHTEANYDATQCTAAKMDPTGAGCSSHFTFTASM